MLYLCQWFKNNIKYCKYSLIRSGRPSRTRRPSRSGGCDVIKACCYDVIADSFTIKMYRPQIQTTIKNECIVFSCDAQS